MSIKRGQERKNINPKQWSSQGGGWEGYSPSIGQSTKMQNKKYHAFSTFETVFRTEIDQKVI